MLDINQENISLGDKRLDKRYEKIIETSLEQPSLSIPSAFKNWHQIKAVYRFLNNPKVTAQKLLEHSYQTTLKSYAYP